MKKIIFLVLAALLLVCASAGCIAEEEPEEKQQFYIDGEYSVYVYVDRETGVEYLIYAYMNKAGMSPRYNADGTLKINEEFRK